MRCYFVNKKDSKKLEFFFKLLNLDRKKFILDKNKNYRIK